MTWNAWTVQVSQRHYRAYKRGGTWLAPQVWRACRAKEAQEQRNYSWGAGNGWRRTGPSFGTPANQRANPPTSKPRARVKPETQEGRTEGGAMAELRAKLEVTTLYMEKLRAAMEAKGVTDIPPKPTMPTPSPEEEHRQDRMWTQRAANAHKEIAKWERIVAEDR